MSKRSSFERRERDFYPTPYEAVIPLLPHLKYRSYYYEPCCGELDLIQHLSEVLDIWDYNDISKGKDALTLTEDDLGLSEYIITNPPWDRKVLHSMIEHFRNLKPTWLLFDADWAHTKQAVSHLKYCAKIVSVGRVKWIPDSKSVGKNNCAWYLFMKDQQETRFYNERERI